VMIPTAFTAAVVLFAGKQKAVAASCVSAAAGLAPTLGPVIGGWITDDCSWHWLFYINIVPGTAVAVLAPAFVRMDEPDLTLLKGADYPGMILMAVCLGWAPLPKRLEFLISICQRPDVILLNESDITIAAACRKHDDDFDDFRVRLAATSARGLHRRYARPGHTVVRARPGPKVQFLSSVGASRRELEVRW
jgi:hypothetical protein